MQLHFEKSEFQSPNKNQQEDFSFNVGFFGAPFLLQTMRKVGISQLANS